ncbi:hypothetical protein TNCV_2163941 [Trichonephila clavipes]|nr:hypothetical protein TNCV_2163941 [Trichonephila clavipes]
MVDITKDLETVDSEPEEDVTPLDEKLLRGRPSTFRELYKELVPSQSLITDYIVKEKKITEVPEEALPCRSDDVILSSSDESDLAPIHKRTRIGIRRTNHQPIDRSGLTLPPVYGGAWAKGHATGTPDSTFPGTGRHTANMRVRLKNQS